MHHRLALLGVEAVKEFGIRSVHSHIALNLPLMGDKIFAKAAFGMAHSTCGFHAAKPIFLRVPVRGTRGGLAAQPESPEVRIRIRGSFLV